MMNAFLDFVGVIHQPAQLTGDHRVFTVNLTSYAGKDASGFKYDTFTFACILPFGERWKRVDPRAGRWVQIQGNFHFPVTHLHYICT